MKKAVFIAVFAISGPAIADEYVNGYVRQNGTYVPGHYRSSNDGNRYNNYSTQGNTNPYTGQQGTVNPYSQPAYQPRQQQSYQAPNNNSGQNRRSSYR